jgi:hypothetical protein
LHTLRDQNKSQAFSHSKQKLLINDIKIRRWKTGGLRRDNPERPFTDVVLSERTPQDERKIVNHPSHKPTATVYEIHCACSIASF